MGKSEVLNKAKKSTEKLKVASREALDRSYQAKIPIAKEKIALLRSANPELTPSEVQDFLNQELIEAESEFGAASVKYSTLASLYVVASAELRELNIKDKAEHQRLMDLVVVIDSKAVRFVRKAIPIALMFIPSGAIAKVAPKSAALITRLSKSKKILVPVVAKVVTKIDTKAKVSKKVIDLTLKSLGNPPTKWPDSGKGNIFATWWQKLFSRKN